MTELPGNAEPDFISEEEASKVLGRPVATIRYWRHTGSGPRYYKIGRRVAYVRADLIDYMLSCAVDPTARRAS